MSRETCDGFWVDDYEWGGGKVMSLTGPWRPEFAIELKRKGIYVLRLSSSNGWDDENVSFLADLHNLSGLEIYHWGLRDIAPIQSLTQLELIGLECDFGPALDFTAFPKLKVCFLTWKPGARSLLQCEALQHLNISRYPYPDISELSCRPRLERLQLSGRKLRSLFGIEECVRLTTLDLFDCPQLRTLQGVAAATSLKEMEFEQCKSLSSLDPLEEMEELVSLVLNDCGRIQSLRPLRQCRNLERLCFTGSTVIDDGDLSVIEQLSKLQVIRFTDRRSYSIQLRDAQAMIGML
jgi:Leucine-rich repeat (LRR) protein